MWWRWTTEVDGTARAAADGDDLSGASAAVGGGSGDDDGRQERTLMGKRLEWVAQHLRAFRMSLAAHNHCIVVVHWSSLPSHWRRPIVEVVLDNVNVEVVVIIVVVVVVVTAVAFHFPIVVVAITAILVVGVVGICRRVAGGVASC